MADTIFAVSSGAPPSGVAVIRVSGPRARDILQAIAGDIPPPRHAALRTLRDPAGGRPLDRGLALWFPGPGSFSGEDSCEFHIHGGRAVVAAALAAIAAIGGRSARPGEFTRRAFDNGKLDLPAVEGLADLIAAETEAQRRQAFAAASGLLSAAAEGWRREIIALRAEVEARLDFADEGDVGIGLPPHFWPRLADLKTALQSALASAAAGERVREGFRVAILGRPNAGKSSLLNALARRDVAIVTPEPGTTRDVMEVSLDLAGYPVVLYDTAGLRDSDSVAEQEGIRRAKRTAVEADLVLWVEDSRTEIEAAPDTYAPVWRVRSKADLSGETGEGAVSVVTGQGLEAVVTRIQAAAAAAMGREPALVTRQRQREALEQAVEALGGITPELPEELNADLLRAAGEAIGRLTGRIDVEDVLDRLFREFCIGK